LPQYSAISKNNKISGEEMKYQNALMVSAALAIVGMLGMANSAFAVSCTEQGKICATTFAVGANAKYKGACLGK
jgi:hypothetical protein